MAGLNCWEVKNCGRQQGGDKEKELGICPAAIESRANGLNSGKNGGRVCWAITGTLCGGKVQGTFATKLGNCLECVFYRQVIEEEGFSYLNTKKIFEALKAG